MKNQLKLRPKSFLTAMFDSAPFDSVISEHIKSSVKTALAEDLGTGDITASLIADSTIAKANLITRENAVLCGTRWFDEVFRQIHDATVISWLYQDGDIIDAGSTICQLEGKAKSLLSGERTALNFLQTLSATATLTRQYVEAVKPYSTQILDTRKTIPGLRLAQKYAVTIGGGKNHRVGLYDGVILKENHQYISHSLPELMARLPHHQNEDLLIEIEVEDLDQLRSALATKANRIMLDNFSISDIKKAVLITNNRVELEASGNVNLGNVAAIANTGVTYISIGSITKNVHAIDFSMKFEK